MFSQVRRQPFRCDEDGLSPQVSMRAAEFHMVQLIRTLRYCLLTNLSELGQFRLNRFASTRMRSPTSITPLAND
eukprot:3711326-Prymnesium_polylepis.2